MPQVVFTTAFDHYAVRAFEVKSLDYLLKPVHRDRLQDAIRRGQEATARGTAEAGTLLRLLEEIKAQRPRRHRCESRPNAAPRSSSSTRPR
jgi:two-component system LytT family response regulator